MESYQLKSMYENEEYTEIISAFDNPEEREGFSEWDYFYAMNASYKLKNYVKCKEIYKTFYKLFPNSDKLNDKMGWAVYHTDIKGADITPENEEQYIKIVEFVLNHCSSSTYSPRFLVTKAYYEAMKSMVNRKDCNRICRYLEMIDEGSLSEEVRETESRGRTVKLASEKEKWHSMLIKSLYDAGRYEDCVLAVDKAMNSLDSFQHNDDSWFMYRKAKSLLALNKPVEAEKVIEDILSKGFSHWSLLQAVFEIDCKIGDMDAALLNGAKCALADRSHEMRVSFYEEYADFLDSVNKEKEAMLHRQLVILLRNENDWPLKRRHNEWDIFSDIKDMDKRAIIKELNDFWHSVVDANKEFFEGYIQEMRDRIGFIKDDNNGRYCFHINDFRGKKEFATVGSCVRFTLEDRLDQKTGKVKPTAFDVMPIR